MIRQLDYQERVLKTLEAYLDALGEEKVKADKIAAVAAEQRRQRRPARVASRASGAVAQQLAPRPVPTQEQPRLASVRCK